MRLLIALAILCVPMLVEAACNPAPDGKTIVCDNQPPWGEGLITSNKTVKSVGKAPKEVIIKYDDFLTIMAAKEHREKLLHQCKAGDAILVQIGKEKDRKIEILEGQIKNLLETAETQEKLGATEAQINEALQRQLAKVTADLEAEKSKKYWWAGMGAASTAALTAVIFMWVVN